jgi:glycosyltransferase involved in cell wall biosynthesis
LKPLLPKINVVAFADNENDVKLIKYAFYRQSYSNRNLFVITDINCKFNDENITILTFNQAQEFKIENLCDSYIAVFNPSDYYGKNYLLDIILTTRYGNFDGIGKANFYTADNNSFVMNGRNKTYKKVSELEIDKSIIKQKALSSKFLYEIKDIKAIENSNLISIDEFNYCKNYTDNICIKVDDLFVSDQGLRIADLKIASEKIKFDVADVNETVISGDKVLKINKSLVKETVTYLIQDGKLIIESNLQESDHQYVYMDDFFETASYIKDGKITLCFNGVGDLDLTGICVFYDNRKNKLTPLFTRTNHLLAAEVPNNAQYFKLGLRPKGSGRFSLSNVVLDAKKDPNKKSCFLSRSNVLALTNQYPAVDNLYRNMFVHKRITAYKQQGFNCDVMRMNIYAKDIVREFDGINIIEGQGETLSSILENGNINTVCVHFLDAHMWSVLKNYTNNIRLIVWIHGSEIQPWWRREYNYGTESELEKGKIESNERMKFWKEVFSNVNQCNIHFVFVSEYFAREVMEDYNIELTKEQYSIIHNCIDTEMFDYVPKPDEQRFKILTIKAFANRKYANDITTKAIVELSRNDIFDKLEFDIYGDGERFDIENAPIKRFKNVHLHRTFLQQFEIADIHKKHGVFIATTRMDAQGVSRDEAMSSGLVPIANNVAAIPEFVDNQCGILVPAEDYKEVANAIIRIYNDSQYFQELSRNAAARVRRQSAKDYTIDKEIKLVWGELK